VGRSYSTVSAKALRWTNSAIDHDSRIGGLPRDALSAREGRKNEACFEYEAEAEDGSGAVDRRGSLAGDQLQSATFERGASTKWFDFASAPGQSRDGAECSQQFDPTADDQGWPARRRYDHNPSRCFLVPSSPPGLPLPVEPSGGQDIVAVPSNFLATSFRYQARIVSGLATQATSASTLRPIPEGSTYSCGASIIFE